MGYYIETGGLHGKAEAIVEQHGGEMVSREAARTAVDDCLKAVIVVMNNGPFEAAGFAFDTAEFEAFHTPGDDRPKKYVVID